MRNRVSVFLCIIFLGMPVMYATAQNTNRNPELERVKVKRHKVKKKKKITDKRRREMQSQDFINRSGNSKAKTRKEKKVLKENQNAMLKDMQEKSGDTRNQRLNRDQKKAIAKAEKKGRKRHMKNQDSQTRKRIKKNKRKTEKRIKKMHKHGIN